MPKKCPVCHTEMPIFKAYCSRPCARKVLTRELFPALTLEAKVARKVDLMTSRPITDRLSL